MSVTFSGRVKTSGSYRSAIVSPGEIRTKGSYRGSTLVFVSSLCILLKWMPGYSEFNCSRNDFNWAESYLLKIKRLYPALEISKCDALHMLRVNLDVDIALI